MTHAPTSEVACKYAGAWHVISVDMRVLMAHAWPPTVTMLEAMYSKPWPDRVSRVPPPAEPSVGEMAVIATTYSKVRMSGTAALPNVGRRTVTDTMPGGAPDAVQVTVVLSSGASATVTLVHA